MGSIWNGGKMKMRHWKMMQMGLVGGEVPMVRCSLHGQILSLTFSGNIFEGPSSWEDQFSDVINREEFAPRNLIPRFAAMLGRQTQNFESNPAARTSPGTANENVLVGKQAPNFKLQLLDGSPFELASFQNKNIVLLDFWATWCGPCRAAMPVLQQLAADFKDKGVLYYAVDLREKPEKVRDYLKETGLKIAVPMDSDGAIGKLYKVTGIPTLVIVGKDGTVQAVQVGFSPDLKDQLKKKLETLIAGKN
jgi:thiol-disulfide isomerase/thioredoxin